MKLYTDLMIDLETLDTAPSAAVRQIGLVAFDRLDPDESDEAFVRTQILVRPDTIPGRSASWDTFKFWLTQSEEARQALIEGVGMELNEALSSVANFVVNNVVEGGLIWGYSSTFDVIILEDAYGDMGVDPPWEYRQHSCLRTLGRVIEVDRPVATIPHVAVEDAHAQARWCKRIHARMEELRAGTKFA